MISKLPRWVWTGGGLLAFSAGMVNAIAFLGFAHQGATHVTGNVSRLSIQISQMDVSHAGLTFFGIASFFLGAIISGMIIRDGHLKMGRRYGFALFLESCLLFLSTYAFSVNSAWGEYLAAAAAGLQNGLVSTYSGAIVRTTHLTGILTDLGVLMGHLAHGMKVDFRRIKLLLILIATFTAGGTVAALLFSRWQNMTMLVPAILISLASAGYFILRRLSLETTPAETA